MGRSARSALVLVLAAAAGCRPAPREATVSAAPAPSAAASALRVCADPNNLPFSNRRGEGFENALAALVARDLGRPLEYAWWPQRRGFVRNTLRAGACDVIMGVPPELDAVLATAPYYTSTYVFVAPRRRALHLHSLDDPRLRRLTIGLPLIGDDYASVPPGGALAARGLAKNVRGYSVYGDYSRESPPADLIEAVARGEVDVAIAWGPLAGYFAARRGDLLEVTPVAPAPGVPLRFAIAMGVRKGDRALRDALDAVLRRRAADVQALLDRFHVPRVEGRGDLSLSARAPS
jgi:mxaJ protein